MPTVTFVNCFDATALRQEVLRTPEEERRLRDVLAVLRVEDDDPTPVPSVRDRFHRWAGAAGHGGRLKATWLPCRDGSYVVFAAAAPP